MFEEIPLLNSLWVAEADLAINLVQSEQKNLAKPLLPFSYYATVGK